MLNSFKFSLPNFSGGIDHGLPYFKIVVLYKGFKCLNNEKLQVFIAGVYSAHSYISRLPDISIPVFKIGDERFYLSSFKTGEYFVMQRSNQLNSFLF